ncbi:MAG TPA: hypothetical protein VGS11_08935 [Candidatus Bathyarchaeia archaeon]|nr:hypothetical protein [Candidatus Bathyarchaeia archaeon]
MTNRPLSGQVPPLAIVLLGTLLVILGFTTYPMVAALNQTEAVRGEGFLITYAYFAFGLDIVGLGILFYGATRLLTSRSMGEASGPPSSITGMVAAAFSRNRYSRLLFASSSAYGLFYAFASGIIVFQPSISFSDVYHAGIPSVAIATCCSPLGGTPQVVAYITQHLGLVLVPVNLLLLFSISWLVGLNASFASWTLSFRTKNAGRGLFGGIGAFIGLFTSCPTCAGLAILSTLGGTGTLSASFFEGSLQTTFVVVSIPILVVAPLISARSLHSFKGQVCVKS